MRKVFVWDWEYRVVVFGEISSWSCVDECIFVVWVNVDLRSFVVFGNCNFNGKDIFINIVLIVNFIKSDNFVFLILDENFFCLFNYLGNGNY